MSAFVTPTILVFRQSCRSQFVSFLTRCHSSALIVPILSIWSRWIQILPDKLVPHVGCSWPTLPSLFLRLRATFSSRYLEDLVAFVAFRRSRPQVDWGDCKWLTLGGNTTIFTLQRFILDSEHTVPALVLLVSLDLLVQLEDRVETKMT